MQTIVNHLQFNNKYLYNLILSGQRVFFNGIEF